MYLLYLTYMHRQCLACHGTKLQFMYLVCLSHRVKYVIACPVHLWISSPLQICRTVQPLLIMWLTDKHSISKYNVHVYMTGYHNDIHCTRTRTQIAILDNLLILPFPMATTHIKAGKIQGVLMFVVFIVILIVMKFPTIINAICIWRLQDKRHGQKHHRRRLTVLK